MFLLIFFLYSQVWQAALPEFNNPVTYSWMLLWCVNVIPKWKELFITNVHKSKSIIAVDEIIQLAKSPFFCESEVFPQLLILLQFVLCV